ncbi:hypothetical protein MRX96_016746 [Rhipicephalus microplus]
MPTRTQSVITIGRKWSRLLRNYALLGLVGILGILLLPLLIVSHRFQESFFAFVYVILQRHMNDEAHGSVRVLEVGAAYGPNLEFVERPIEYSVVEPNRSFKDSFMENIKKNSKVELKWLIFGHGENMSMLPDGHFDAVVLFYVLCSAKDGSKLLSECKRVLKKGGHFLFAEHVAHKKGTLSRFIQDLLTPLTKNFGCGCHLNRESGVLLRSAGFSRIDINTADINVPLMFSHNIYGVATA